jgi:hypothetical protein
MSAHSDVIGPASTIAVRQVSMQAVGYYVRVGDERGVLR